MTFHDTRVIAAGLVGAIIAAGAIALRTRLPEPNEPALVRGGRVDTASGLPRNSRFTAAPNTGRPDDGEHRDDISFAVQTIIEKPDDRERERALLNAARRYGDQGVDAVKSFLLALAIPLAIPTTMQTEVSEEEEANLA